LALGIPNVYFLTTVLQHQCPNYWQWEATSLQCCCTPSRENPWLQSVVILRSQEVDWKTKWLSNCRL